MQMQHQNQLFHNNYKKTHLDFLEQCSIGDIYQVRSMLNNNLIDINYQHPINGWTGLHWAAKRAHEAICLLLLDYGFSRETCAFDGRTPWAVCPPDKKTVREILRPSDKEEGEHTMPVASGSSRRNSTDSNGSTSTATPTSPNQFTPSYIKHPPFPYLSKSSSNSFDNGPTPGSPTTPTKTNGAYYSYGRKDSINRTRFLLVRTSVCDGKEAFKRITLPGGATVDQLKKTVEKSMKLGRVEAILTLPDRVMVEDDSQIGGFTDCQKIDVIFNDKEESPQPLGDIPVLRKASLPNIEPPRRAKVFQRSQTVMDSVDRGDIIQEHTYEEEFPALDVDIPLNHPEKKSESPPAVPATEPVVEPEVDSTTEEQEEPEVREEQEIQAPVVEKEESEEPEAPVATVVEEQQTFEEKMDELVKSNLEEEQEGSVGIRERLDSDPGDYVKVDREDVSLPMDISIINSLTDEKTSPVEAINEKTVPFPEEVHFERKEEKRDRKISEPAIVVEETKVPPKEDGGIDWSDKNTELRLRQAAAVAAVVGIAGLGYWVYIRKFK